MYFADCLRSLPPEYRPEDFQLGVGGNRGGAGHPRVSCEAFIRNIREVSYLASTSAVVDMDTRFAERVLSGPNWPESRSCRA